MTYSDQEVAALYGILNPWSQSDDFYLGLVMNARAALDVGCGTGVILHSARLDGHTGRLCGSTQTARCLRSRSVGQILNGRLAERHRCAGSVNSTWPS